MDVNNFDLFLFLLETFISSIFSSSNVELTFRTQNSGKLTGSPITCKTRVEKWRTEDDFHNIKRRVGLKYLPKLRADTALAQAGLCTWFSSPLRGR